MHAITKNLFEIYFSIPNYQINREVAHMRGSMAPSRGG